MATYLEIDVLKDSIDLRKKVESAVLDAAYRKLIGDTPTAAELNWATTVLNGPCDEVTKALRALILKNKASDVATITGLTYSGIQTDIDTVVDNLIVAFNA